MLIDRAEYQKALFSDRDRDLIVNYAYQTGDLEKTRQLLQGMAQALDSQDMPGYWAAVRQAESEIEAVQLMESSVPAQRSVLWTMPPISISRPRRTDGTIPSMTGRPCVSWTADS